MNSSPNFPSLRAAVALSAVVLALAVEPLHAQGTAGHGNNRGWTRVRVAKWALFGAAVAFGGYALQQSSRAERAYDSLRELCRTEPTSCELTDGDYSSPQAEYYYQTALFRDRRARIGIFGGQVALLGSVGLFIYDLGTPRGPVNIPYPGGSGGAAVASSRTMPGFAAPPRTLAAGLRIAF